MIMNTVLVTGAGGYIGSISCDLLLNNGYSIVALDNLSNGYIQPIETLQKKYSKEKIVFYNKDLLGNLDDVFDENKIDAVLHYGALCKVNESMDEPGLYFKNNVMGVQNLLDAMNKYKVNKIVFSSTCAVYGNAQTIPMDETHPTNPENPYGESKLMAERVIEWYGKVKNINYVILRYFNVCGASDDGTIGDSKKPSVLLVQNAVRGALGIEQFKLTCPEVDTPDKTPIRDYINVVDLNEAHLKALEYLNKGGVSQIINLGTGQGNSVKEIIDIVQKETGKQFDVGKAEPRKGEYAKVTADITKASEVLGWKPKRTISDSIQSLIKWYSHHPEGWEK